MPTPSSSTVITQSVPSSRATISTEPPLSTRKPVPHGVFHQRLQRQERHHDVEHLGRHLQLDLQRGAEPRPFQAQVAVDVAQFLGQGRVLPGGAERVPGEVGEVEDEFTGAVGVGAHERGDGVQRVVDEVRTDLRPQREHLGAVEPRAGRVQLRQFDLAGRIARHFADGAHHARPGRAGRHHHEHADAPRCRRRAAAGRSPPVDGRSASVAGRRSTPGPRVRMRRRPPAPRFGRRADRAPATRRRPSNMATPSAPVSRADAERPRAPNPGRALRAARGPPGTRCAAPRARHARWGWPRRGGSARRTPRRPGRPPPAPPRQPSGPGRTSHLTRRPFGRPHRPVGAGFEPLADQCDARPSGRDFVTTLTPHDRHMHRRSRDLCTVPGVRRPGQRDRRSVLGGRCRPIGILGEASREAVVADAVHRRVGLVGGAGRQVVRRRQAQRGLQLRGPPRRGGQR